MKVSELARSLECTLDVSAPLDFEITGVASLQDARPGELTFVSEAKLVDKLEQTEASAAIVAPDLAVPDRLVGLRHPQPRLAFARAIAFFYQPYAEPPGIHPTAVVAPDVQLGTDVAIGPYAVIMAGTRIGDRAQVHAHAVVYPQVEIGDDCVLYAHCVIHERTQLGTGCIIHSGAVIGDDGFGHVPQANGTWYRMLQSGRVVLGNGVDVGSNATIDRAAVGETRLSDGIKLDNLCQVGHGVHIGQHSLFAAQGGIAGGTELGQNVIVGGQVGIAGHLTIGDRVIVASRSGVSGNISGGQTYAGFPLQPVTEWRRSMAAVRNLPDLVQKVRDLKKRMAQLEREIAESSPDAQSLSESE